MFMDKSFFLQYLGQHFIHPSGNPKVVSRILYLESLPLHIAPVYATSQINGYVSVKYIEQAIASTARDDDILHR